MLSALSTRMGARARRTLAAATVLLAFAGATACGDDDDDPTGPDDEVGTYALREVDDESVPVIFSNGVDDLEFSSGSLVLSDNGSFTATLNVELNGQAGQYQTTGDYDLNGNDITLTGDDGDDIIGELNGDDLEFPDVPFDLDDDGVDDVSFKLEFRKP